MKTIQVRHFGESVVLLKTEIDVPQSASGLGRVRIHASGVNPVNTYLRAGVYPMFPQLP